MNIITLILALHFSLFTTDPGQSTHSLVLPIAWQSTDIKDVDVPEFRKLSEESNVLLLDVRTPEEFEQGHIEGAKNINFNDPKFKSNLMGLAKDQKVLVYCRSGRRSGMAMNLMGEMGFKQVYNLTGGILAWEQSKMPIKK